MSQPVAQWTPLSRSWNPALWVDYTILHRRSLLPHNPQNTPNLMVRRSPKPKRRRSRRFSAKDLWTVKGDLDARAANPLSLSLNFVRQHYHLLASLSESHSGTGLPRCLTTSDPNANRTSHHPVGQVYLGPLDSRFPGTRCWRFGGTLELRRLLC